MKIEDIIALCNAGFTKAEIMKAANTETKPETEPETKPETTPETKPENSAAGLVETVKALAETVKALQAANVGKDVSGGNKPETAENILEKLINGGNDNADK